MKLHGREVVDRAVRSHPTGVRGLKSVDLRVERKGYVSHPTGVRGLKSGNGRIHR